MTRRPTICGPELQEMMVPPTATISETLGHMTQEAALVVDDRQRLLGLVTDGDVRRNFLRGGDMETPVSNFMSGTPFTVSEGSSYATIRRTMVNRGIRHLPVVDASGRVVGLELLKSVLSEPATAKAVIMAGGKGSRLMPLTAQTPKPLLKVGNRTILDTVLGGLHRHGIDDVVLAVNYLADKIRSHAGNGEKYDLNISYLEEEQQLGTAGALALLKPRPRQNVLVMNADLLTDLDLRAFIGFHSESGNDATLCVKRERSVNPYGVVQLDEDALSVQGIVEKPVSEFYVNAGIYMISPELIDLVPENEFFDMTSLLERALQHGYHVGAFPVIEYWRDIGRHDEMNRVNEEWASRHHEAVMGRAAGFGA